MKRTGYFGPPPTTCMAAILRLAFLIMVCHWAHSTGKRLINAIEDIRDAVVDAKGTPTACAIGTGQTEMGARNDVRAE